VEPHAGADAEGFGQSFEGNAFGTAAGDVELDGAALRGH
jgi:hypothetical protein